MDNIFENTKLIMRNFLLMIIMKLSEIYEEVEDICHYKATVDYSR